MGVLIRRHFLFQPEPQVHSESETRVHHLRSVAIVEISLLRWSVAGIGLDQEGVSLHRCRRQRFS